MLSVAERRSTTKPAAAPDAPAQPASGTAPGLKPGAWWAGLGQQWAEFAGHVWQEVKGLVRVTRIDKPEAMLVAPEQAFFLKENLKLRLLNARLALLSRQFDTAQSDLRDAQSVLDRYFDRNARRVVVAADLVRQVTSQARLVSVPRPDTTLAAIATASAGR
jgi:uroporphyrin-3 C-methyltransferase